MNQVSFNGITNANAVTNKVSKPKTMLEKRQQAIEDGDNKSLDALKWAGIIAAGALAVGGAVHFIKKGRVPKLEQVKDESGKLVSKIKGKTYNFKNGNIGFETLNPDGTVSFKKAEGLLKFTTNNGSTLTYNNGVLTSAVKEGKNGFRKLYNTHGKLYKAVYDFGDSAKKVICKHNKSGKIKLIKDPSKGITKLNYKSDGTLDTINGRAISSIQADKAANNWANSVGDMSTKGLLKAQIEEKIADGQISSLKDALDLGYSAKDIKNLGFNLK